MSVEVASLLARLCDLGVEVAVRGDRLYVRGAESPVPGDVRKALHERKGELIVFMGRRRFLREELDALGFVGTPCEDGGGEWEVRVQLDPLWFDSY